MQEIGKSDKNHAGIYPMVADVPPIRNLVETPLSRERRLARKRIMKVEPALAGVVLPVVLFSEMKG